MTLTHIMQPSSLSPSHSCLNTRQRASGQSHTHLAHHVSTQQHAHKGAERRPTPQAGHPQPCITHHHKRAARKELPQMATAHTPNPQPHPLWPSCYITPVQANVTPNTAHHATHSRPPETAATCPQSLWGGIRGGHSFALHRTPHGDGAEGAWQCIALRHSRTHDPPSPYWLAMLVEAKGVLLPEVASANESACVSCGGCDASCDAGGAAAAYAPPSSPPWCGS